MTSLILVRNAEYAQKRIMKSYLHKTRTNRYFK